MQTFGPVTCWQTVAGEQVCHPVGPIGQPQAVLPQVCGELVQCWTPVGPTKPG
ncbi:MAG TPA: hypothetical protein VKT33_11235 [Candidatus Angelobacter sp.]|nr:hypothetical protein [Candidatus Angelobacter sp.]